MIDKEWIFQKKDWTGDEIGKIFIRNEVCSYNQAVMSDEEKKANPEELLRSDELQRIADTLKDPDQIEHYKRYVGLRNWIIQYRDMALARYNHVCREIDRLQEIALTIGAVEDAYKRIERMPVIMTQKQYDELRAKGIDGQLASGGQWSVFAMIGVAVHYFIDRLQREPKKVNPVRRIKKTYQSERVRSARVLRVIEEKGLKDPSKWDVLAAGDLLFACYPAMLEKAAVEEADYIAQAEDFNAEFPDLLEAVAKEIDRRFFEGLRGVGDLSIKEWRGVTFTMRELYDLDYFGVRERIESDAGVFGGDKRVLTKGVAVLKSSSLPVKSPLIDERGCYAAPEGFGSLRAICGIEQFMPENDKYSANLQKFNKGRRLIEDGCRYVFGYERALEVIVDYMNIPNIIVSKTFTNTIIGWLDNLNCFLDHLDDLVQRTDYRGRDWDLYKPMLRELFSPIQRIKFTVPEGVIVRAEELLTYRDVFDTPNDIFIDLFTKH